PVAPPSARPGSSSAVAVYSSRLPLTARVPDRCAPMAGPLGGVKPPDGGSVGVKRGVAGGRSLAPQDAVRGAPVPSPAAPTALAGGGPWSSGQQLDRQSGEDLWGSILKTVSTSRAIPTKNVVVLGDPNTGKSTLVAHLADASAAARVTNEAAGEEAADAAAVGKKARKQSTADPRVFGENSELALSYSYADVRDEDNEDLLAHLGIFQLGASEPVYRSLLSFAINADTLPDSLVVITLDWTRPWRFVETLQRWLSVFEESVLHVEHEGGGRADGKWSRGKARRIALRPYHVLVIRTAGALAERATYADGFEKWRGTSRKSAGNRGSKTVMLPLEEGILTKNFGVPLVVVCCKLTNDSSYLFAPSADGAALFYTSQQRPESFSRLREYILHRLLSIHPDSRALSTIDVTTADSNVPSGGLNSPKREAFAFSQRAQIIEKDMVLVPAGWDSRGKILLLAEGFSFEPAQEGGQVLVNVFAEVVKDSYANHATSLHTPHVTVEDEQAFLERHFDFASRGDHSHRRNNPGALKARKDNTAPLGSTGSTQAGAVDIQDDVLARLSRYSKSAKVGRAIGDPHFGMGAIYTVGRCWTHGTFLDQGTSTTLPQSSTISAAGQPGGFSGSATSITASADAAKDSAVSASSSSSATNNDVLASFFQSLLNKNSTGTASQVSSSGANSPRHGTSSIASGSAARSTSSVGAGGGPLSSAGEDGGKSAGSRLSPDSRRQSVAAELSRMKAAAKK
ncbi:MAG: hypothetical protein BJ554DRAFT_6730, partial [Olpidium bornovanus]